jgi:hypothetical protein
MSALMDNPLGNVAMLFFQFECIGISPIYWPPARSAYASERRLGMMSGKKVCSTKNVGSTLFEDAYPSCFFCVAL